MNVTNIGFPLPTPTAQGGNAEAAAGTGFAGLLGTVAGDAAQGPVALGMPDLGAALLTAQTNAPLLPGTGAPGSALPGDRPQVAMAQLLATSAPGAMTQPVATGGNPLADAVAKALAGAQGKTADAPAAADTLPAEPGTTPAQPKPNSAKPAPASSGTDALAAALEPAVALPPEAAEQNQPAPPVKTAAKPLRGANAKEADLDPAGAPLPAPEAAAAPVQPIAVAIAQPQPQQPVAQPATPQAVAQNKTSGVAAPRYAKTDAPGGNDAAPAQTTNDKLADLADAVAARPHGGGADGGTAGDHGQQNFGQQLAAADTNHGGTGAVPFPTASGHVAPTANAAPAAATAEPVLNARAGELGRSLGVEIARKVDAGEDTLRVRLNPAELGRVEVTLAFDDKGRVQATMRAESQHTLDLLRQDAPDLGRALDQAGIRSDANSFRFESRDGSTGTGGNGQSGSQQQSRGGNQQFRDEPEVQTAAYRPIRGDGQVDLIA